MSSPDHSRSWAGRPRRTYSADDNDRSFGGTEDVVVAATGLESTDFLSVSGLVRTTSRRRCRPLRAKCQRTW